MTTENTEQNDHPEEGVAFVSDGLTDPSDAAGYDERFWAIVDNAADDIIEHEIGPSVRETQAKIYNQGPYVPGRGRWESQDVLPGVRNQLSNSVRSIVADGVRETESLFGPPSDEESQAARTARGVIAHIKGDMLGVDSPNVAIYIEGGEPSSPLGRLLEDDGEGIADKDIPIIEHASKIILAAGQYKLMKWGNGKMLETGMKLVEDMTALYDSFDPDRAGVFQVLDRSISAVAATNVELQSKPNYRYAKPELYPFSEQNGAAMRSAAQIIALRIVRQQIESDTAAPVDVPVRDEEITTETEGDED
jgi:hypothetical protein